MNPSAQSRMKLKFQARREDIDPANAVSSRRVYNDAALSDAILQSHMQTKQTGRELFCSALSLFDFFKPKYNALNLFEVDGFSFCKLLSS